MDDLALLLSRLQFAFTISFHIIFPSFSIGLAAWLTILEALRMATGRSVYRVVFEFWFKIFGVRDGSGVRHRHGLPVRHELGGSGPHGRPDPGCAPFVRDLHGVFP